MSRAAFVVAAVASLFFFPWPYTLALGFIASLFIPILGIALGVFYDALYFSSAHMPYGTLAGALVSILALTIRRFMKSRLSDFSRPGS